MKIIDANLKFIDEPLIAPFGFKGGYGNSLWQVAVRVCTKDNYGVGVSTQSVLWSDSNVFKSMSFDAGNAAMLMVTEYALKLLKEIEFETPIEAISKIEDELYAYAKVVTNNASLKKTFVLNALVCVDNALWQLYSRESGVATMLELVGDEYKDCLTNKHSKLSNIPLITYGVGKEQIKALVDEGYACLKIKIGSDPDKDGSLDKMLSWDKNRIKEIHDIAKDAYTPYTDTGKVVYYLDANGRYDSKERLNDLIEYTKEIGAFDRIIILEEPFCEENHTDVSDIELRIAADESAHSVEDVMERVKLGYKAFALKPVAKTLSVSLQMLKIAEQHNIPCFCADLTVAPVTREFNKFMAARMNVFPGMRIGMVESNGAQNYVNWENMLSYHPMYKRVDWIEPLNGIFNLSGDYFDLDGGIFRDSVFYEKLTRK